MHIGYTSQAELTQAKFLQATLSQAKLSQAKPSQAKLSQAKLSAPNPAQAHILVPTQTLSRASDVGVHVYANPKTPKPCPKHHKIPGRNPNQKA